LIMLNPGANTGGGRWKEKRTPLNEKRKYTVEPPGLEVWVLKPIKKKKAKKAVKGATAEYAVGVKARVRTVR